MTRLKAMSYNIHGGLGRRGFDPDAVARVIEHHAPDVVALQEVTDVPYRASRLSEWLSERLGMYLVRGAVRRAGERPYGNAVLSRHPIGGLYRRRYVAERREVRGFVDAAVVLGKRQNLRVVSTHLGLNGAERRAQTRELCTHVAGISSPCLVMGDFNEFRRSNPLDRLLAAAGFTPAPRLATFPTRWPLLALDRAYLSRHCELLDARSDRSKPARAASDHLPLLVEFAVDWERL